MAQNTEETAAEGLKEIWYLVEYGGQELWRFLALGGVVLGGYVGGKIIGTFFGMLESRVAKEERPILEAVWGTLARSFGPIGLALGVRFGLLFLETPERVELVLSSIAGVLIVIAVGWTCFCFVEVPTVAYKKWSARQESTLTDMLVPILRTGLRVTVVVLTIVQIAQVVSDKPVSSILAGLGIGGLAFALAAQDSLKHLFGSVVIFTDRPFEVGDRLVVDGHDGPVEEVGFRSTKIRTLDGHLVTIPNGNLVNQPIKNISKRPHIRRLCDITITYDTAPDKIEEAVAIVKDILKDHEGMDPEFPPQVYFNNLNSDSLNLFVIYWYHPPAYWDFLAFNERFNLAVIRRFGEAGIDFAFPTQTLYLAGDGKRPLNIGIHDRNQPTSDPH